MTHISAIAPISDFMAAKDAGFISLRPHQLDADVVVANYTPAQQYRNIWDAVTLASRGLIFRLSNGEIVARPFGKFFNHGDPKTDHIDTSGAIEVMDKADGSCGILYKAPDGRFSVSTRGSMHSEQAEHATALYRERYEPVWTPHEDYTFVYEIIYPDGRIVLDYKGMDDLILLGAVNKATGVSVNRAELEAFNWPGPIIEVFEFDSYPDVFRAEQVSGREGFVVRFVDSDARIKVKFEDYLMLHRFTFDLTERRVWAILAAVETDIDIDEWLLQVPDEFTEEARGWRDNLRAAYADILSKAEAAYATHVHLAGNRREFAQALIASGASAAVKAVVFAMLDNADDERISGIIWKALKV